MASRKVTTITAEKINRASFNNLQSISLNTEEIQKTKLQDKTDCKSDYYNKLMAYREIRQLQRQAS